MKEEKLNIDIPFPCDVEQMMDELKCKGDRVHQQDIVERIEGVEFTKVKLCGQLFLFCGIKMKGGFVAIGKPSACIDPENWREQIGMKVAMDNSFEMLWQLEAYRKLSAE